MPLVAIGSETTLQCSQSLSSIEARGVGRSAETLGEELSSTPARPSPFADLPRVRRVLRDKGQGLGGHPKHSESDERGLLAGVALDEAIGDGVPTGRQGERVAE